MDINEIKKNELIKEIATDFFAYTPKSIIQKIYGKNEPITESGSLLMLVLSKTDANKMIEFIDKIYVKNFEEKKESIKKKISELIPEKYEKKLEDYELHFLDIKHNSSLKDELSKLPLENSQGNFEFNHDKYFLRLYSRYTELTNKGIDCDIYVGTPAGHYFVSKEQLVKEFNKDDATSYMLSDAKGQCIFNKEIFEEQNQYEKIVPKYYTEEYLDEKFMMDDLLSEGWNGKEIQGEIWATKEEMKQGNAKSEYIKIRKVPNEQKYLSSIESFNLLALLKNENNEFTKDESAKAKWILENSGVIDYFMLNAELDVLLCKIKERQESDKSILSQIKEIAPNYNILTIDEYNSKLFIKIENKEELESKYTKFLELELSSLQKNSKVIEKAEDMDYDNSISINK